MLAGSAATAGTTYVSVRFPARYFTTRSLTPLAVYCLAAGAWLVAWFGLHG